MRINLTNDASYELRQYEDMRMASSRLADVSINGIRKCSLANLLLGNTSEALRYCNMMIPENATISDCPPCDQYLDRAIKASTETTPEETLRAHYSTFYLLEREPSIFSDLFLGDVSMECETDEDSKSTFEESSDEPEDSDGLHEDDELLPEDSDEEPEINNIKVPEIVSPTSSDEFVKIKKPDFEELKRKVSDLQALLKAIAA
eukprot:TRINITY_DN16372_c0_g1_i3.p1 TRINITY_DN16372_c0_g1~~TRINITY_DN16372_c0_g1_i3.p1  ORF type:complete len:204 (+),score=32.01 TRINITY_DN16372_c0_g1_i3:323-934(+)